MAVAIAGFASVYFGHEQAKASGSYGLVCYRICIQSKSMSVLKFERARATGSDSRGEVIKILLVESLKLVHRISRAMMWLVVFSGWLER